MLRQCPMTGERCDVFSNRQIAPLPGCRGGHDFSYRRRFAIATFVQLRVTVVEMLDN